MAILFTTINSPSAIDTDAYGINDAGQIVGSYYDGSPVRGFPLSGGGYTLLNAPTTTPGVTVATDINTSGQIVGYYNFEINRSSFLYSNGTYTTIAISTSGANGGPWARGINDAGQIVGYVSDFILVPHLSYGKVTGFLYSNGTLTTIDDPLAVGNS